MVYRAPAFGTKGLRPWSIGLRPLGHCVYRAPIGELSAWHAGFASLTRWGHAADVCAAAAARPHCLSPRRFGPPAHPAVAGASPLHRPRSLAGQSPEATCTPSAVRYRRRRLGERHWRVPRSGSCAPAFCLAPCPDSGPSLPPRSAASVSTNRRRCRRAPRQYGGAHLPAPAQHSYRRGNPAQRWMNSGCLRTMGSTRRAASRCSRQLELHRSLHRFTFRAIRTLQQWGRS